MGVPQPAGRQAGPIGSNDLVGQDELLVPQFLGFRAPALAEADHHVADLAANLVERGLAFHDPSRIHVHVVGHAPIRLGIGADLDHRRDRRADHRSAPGDEQDGMAAAGDQFGDFGIVVDVGKAEANFAVGDDVEQVEAAARRNVAGLDETRDRRARRTWRRRPSTFLR